MTRASLIQTSMRGGELSRAVRARHDIAAFPDAQELCQNALVRVAGPADKRAGFVDLGAAKSSSAARLKWLVMRKSSRDVVRIEICAGVMRFWDGMTRTLITSGGSPVEVAHPWSEDDLPGLKAWQSGDVMWIAHVGGAYPLKVLRRTAANAFALTDYVFEEGPFRPREKGVTLTFSHVSGSGRTCTASASVFTADHVGALIRAEAITFAGMQSWAFDSYYDLNAIARYGNNIYECTTRGASNKAGDAAPIHTQGVAWDGGEEKLEWTFRGFTHGLARITGYTNATTVTVEILQRLPFYGATALVSDLWQFGAFCPAFGYPRAGTIHEERLVPMGSLVEPDTVFASASAQYDPISANFFPGALTEVVDDNAIRRTIANGETNPIVWGLSLDALIVGTEGGVFRLAPPTPDEGLTPAGANSRLLCAIPASEYVSPITTPTSFIYVPFYETELIEVQRGDQVEPRNLAELAEHLVAAGVRSLAFARKPSNAIWLVDEEGQLAAFTYSPENQVVAGSRHVLGGSFDGGPPEIDDICVGPGPYRTEEVWASVRRTINGATVRRIEYMERVFNTRRMRVEDACCLDAAGYFDQWNADPTKTMTFTPSSPGAATGTLQAAGHTPFNSGHVGRTIFLRKVKLTPKPSDVRWPVRLLITGYTDSDTVSVATVGEYDGLLAGEAVSQWAFAVTALSGLSRLEGETVRINADGGDYGPDLDRLRSEPDYVDARYVVTSGSVSLPEPVARGWVGLPYRQHLRSLPLNAGEASGAARGSLKRVDRVFVMIDGAAAGEVRVVGTLEAGVQLAGRQVSDFMGTAPPAAEADVWEELPSGFDRDGQIEVINDTALPCGLAGWVLRVTTNA